MIGSLPNSWRATGSDAGTHFLVISCTLVFDKGLQVRSLDERDVHLQMRRLFFEVIVGKLTLGGKTICVWREENDRRKTAPIMDQKRQALQANHALV